MCFVKVILPFLFLTNQYFAAIVLPKISSVQHPPLPEHFFNLNTNSVADYVNPELSPG